MSVPVPEEWEAVAREFGVELEQVRRDHLISHVLAALCSAISDEDLIFFGGTALARTHLPQGRLSEDIDLIALAPRPQVAARIEEAIHNGVLRTHGRPTWTPPPTAARDAQSANLTVPDGTTIQVQLLAATGFPGWPTEVLDLHQRYSDAPPAQLRVLTVEAFIAAKMSAWLDRRTPRDLWDLAALSEAGKVTAAAVACFARFGTTSKPLPTRVFTDPPAEGLWMRALAHQTRLTMTAAEALGRVREAWVGASEA